MMTIHSVVYLKKIEREVIYMALYNPENTLAVTKAAIAQLISKKYMDADYELDALDDTSIVELGEKIGITEDGDFEVGSPADVVFKAFIGQLAKINIDNREYVASLPSLFVDPINWGIMTENVMIGLSDVMIDEMWNPDGYIPWNTEPDPLTPTVFPGVEEGKRIAAIEFGFYRPAIDVKLYKKAKAIMVAITTMRDQLFTAFRGVDELNKFLAGLYNSVNNTLQLKAEIYAKMTVSTGIGRAFVNSNAIDMRSMYVTETGDTTASTMTADALLNYEKFQRYVLQTVAKTKEYIKDYTALYNNGDQATFAADPRTILLTDFVMNCKFGVRANTFNEELLGIGKFDKCNKWQAAVSSGVSTPYNVENAGRIVFSKNAAIEIGLLPSDTEETKYTTDIVLGVSYDRLAMGITVDKKKTTTQYAASRDTVNSFYHALANYVVNDNYPIVVYYISEPTEDDGEGE
ncbi:MAG: hypothetical protein J6R32_08565 [Bacteroidales bacterium]|nr:hypothetical protein [Bacteroidales bacterium]